MIYKLKNGRTVDTARECDFEQRNFLQKMIIYKHLKADLAEFRSKWRTPGNPVWQGPQTLTQPSAAAQILLDMEKDLG